jgi:hypothetical protein
MSFYYLASLTFKDYSQTIITSLFKINDKWFRILIIAVPFLEDAWANNLLITPFNGRWIATALVSLCTLILVCEGSRFIARYKMLSLSVPVIEKDDAAFAVIIPLAIPNAQQQKRATTAQPVLAV